MTKNTKLFAYFISLFLIVLICLIWISVLLTNDISDEKLGPSPFKLDPTISLEDNNKEFQEIVGIGNAIVDEENFLNNYKLDLNNTQPSILVLQNYIDKNKLNIDKITPELLKGLKFPESFNNILPLNAFKSLYVLLQRKITLEILTLI